MTPLAIALIVLVAMFLLGLPIFMSLIISSVVAILAGGDILPLSVIHNSLFDGLNLFPLLALQRRQGQPGSGDGVLWSRARSWSSGTSRSRSSTW